MDHLGAQFRAFGSPRFLGYTYDYDKRGFHNFPERVGWKVFNEYKCEPCEHLTLPPRPFSAFLQSWLFFGLLAAVLGESIGNKEVLDKFIKKGIGGYLIKTDELEKLLKDWEAREVEDREGQTMRMVRIQVALDRARGVVNRYCSYKDYDAERALSSEPKRAKDLEVDDMIALSLMILGETLTNAKSKIVQKVGFRIRGWHGDAAEGWGTSRCVIQKMREDGWCENTIHMLKGQLRNHATSLLSAYLANQYRRPGKHECCTKDKCKLTTFDRNHIYQPQHSPYCRRTKAKCPLVGPNLDTLINIINANGIPLLSFTESESGLGIEVNKCEKYDEYAAISHVWADGYGNPKSNKLHQCQLEFFSETLKKAHNLFKQGRSVPGVDKQIRFWIDTLTIPVGSDYRDQRITSISQIHEIYTGAKYTIVIDNELSKMGPGEEYSDTAMRILASGWMRRLWTLQEAYLSKRLFFNLNQEVLDLDELEGNFLQANDKLTSNIAATARNYFHSLLGTDRETRTHENRPEHGFGLLASVWKATQWRTTSHPEHETLALATLLNVNPRSFAGAGLIVENKESASDYSLEERMKLLWAHLEERFPGSIPAGIIFLPPPRLISEGFGWAPKTWMSGREVDYPDPLAISAQGAKLMIGKGLLVEYPGFLLHARNRSRIMMDVEDYFRFPADSSLLEWYRVTKADPKAEDQPKGNLNPRGSNPYAIILPRQRPQAIPEIGLLVEIEEKKPRHVLGERKASEVFYVFIVFRVWIQRDIGRDLPRDWDFRLTGPENDSDKLICGEVLDADQKWCVGNRAPSSSNGQRVNVLPGRRSGEQRINVRRIDGGGQRINVRTEGIRGPMMDDNLNQKAGNRNKAGISGGKGQRWKF